MAYVSGEISLIAQGIGGRGKIWDYTTTEATGSADANDYISNGSALGMTVSDTVILKDTQTPLTSMHRVESVTAGGAADLAVGTTVGSATTGD